VSNESTDGQARKESSCRFGGFQLDDEGHINQAHAIAVPGEHDKGPARWRKVGKITRRHRAGSAVGETDCERLKGNLLELFFDGFFLHAPKNARARGDRQFREIVGKVLQARGRIRLLLCPAGKRQRTGAVQNAGAQIGPHCSRSVLDCAWALALFGSERAGEHDRAEMPARAER